MARVELGLVIVSPPPPAAQAPSPRRNVLEEHVPDQSVITSALAASEIAPVVVVFFTIPVPRVAQFWLLVPRVWVAVLETPDPPLAAATVPELTSDPAMLLFVNVWVSVVPTTAPVGATTVVTAPVVVVIFANPVESPERSVPLIPTTVVAPPVDVLVASPVRAENDPPPPPADHEQTEGFAAVQERNVLLPDACAPGHTMLYAVPEAAAYCWKFPDGAALGAVPKARSM